MEDETAANIPINHFNDQDPVRPHFDNTIKFNLITMFGSGFGAFDMPVTVDCFLHDRIQIFEESKVDGNFGAFLDYAYSIAAPCFNGVSVYAFVAFYAV